MMSDDLHVDDNNNDGKSTCHVTSFNRCCDSKAKLVLHSRDPNKGVQPTDFTKAKEDIFLKSLQSTNGNRFPACDKSPSAKADVEQRELPRGVGKDISEVETSPDELELDDSSSSSEKENQSTGVSPVCNQAKSAPIRILRKQTSLRGILKYPSGWRRRAYSESSALVSASSISDDNGFYGTSLDSPDALFEFEDDSCAEDTQGLDKPKRNVTFSEKIVSDTFVFRPNSSILGRRLKNQKKAKRRKDKKLRDSAENIANDENLMRKPKDDIEATKHFIEMQRLPFVDSCDSTTDVSSSSGCETSASECSCDEAPCEVLNEYQHESKDGGNKSKRGNRRKRNRKNKQSVRMELETGDYDSD